MSSLLEPVHWVVEQLQHGIAIPAHPLALDSNRRFDEPSQSALTRYYHAAGAGGLAVGVHTTQFSIRNSEHDLFRPVLELAAQRVKEEDQQTGRTTVLIAGVVGKTKQALEEARLASDLGYHAALLSLAGLPNATDQELLQHAQSVAEVIPLFGFYLQPAVGGRPLSRSFWREFCQIENVIAIKVAPFNRYATLDVVRGLAESGRASQVALYTGNDDSILSDLLTEYHLPEAESLRFVGGLLGHWAVWTKRAVETLESCRSWREAGNIPGSALTLGVQITEMNAALFDPANDYAGCIPGIQYVLHKQGLIESIHTLDPSEVLSSGQREEIDRVCRAYPGLTDNEFVREHLDVWRK